MTGPISPDEIPKAKREHIPPEVFAAFNELIAAGYTAGYVTIKQDDVIELILTKMGDKIGGSRDVFSKGWLNVEEAYEDVGWTVRYDKPAYNEDYPATFQFKAAKPR